MGERGRGGSESGTCNLCAIPPSLPTHHTHRQSCRAPQPTYRADVSIACGRCRGNTRRRVIHQRAASVLHLRYYQCILPSQDNSHGKHAEAGASPQSSLHMPDRLCTTAAFVNFARVWGRKAVGARRDSGLEVTFGNTKNRRRPQSQPNAFCRTLATRSWSPTRRQLQKNSNHHKRGPQSHTRRSSMGLRVIEGPWEAQLEE